MSDVLANEASAVDLNEVTDFEKAHGAIQLGEQPGHGGLAGAWIAKEGQVVCELDVLKALCLPFTLHIQEGKVGFDLLFDIGEAYQGIQLGLDDVQRPRWFPLRLGQKRSEMFLDP